LQILLERGWELAALDAEKRMEVAQLAFFVFLGYAQALRGWISKIELTGILKYFEEGGTAQQKHVFKQVGGEQQHFFPISVVTGSGIRVRDWVGCLL
jgi:hypothetical protein